MNPETRLQQQVTHLLRRYESTGALTWFPVPNSIFVAGRSIRERNKRVAQLKACGLLRPGPLDLVICLPGGRVGHLELKIGDNALEPSQKAMIERLEALGHLHAVARDLYEAAETIARWLAVTRLGRAA